MHTLPHCQKTFVYLPSLAQATENPPGRFQAKE
jgi:hypothetical protein